MFAAGSAGNGPSYSNRMYPWSEASWDELYGYAVVTAVNATYLSWQFIDSATDAVVDHLVITQDFEPWVVTVDNPIATTDSSSQSYYSPVVQIVVVTIGCCIFIATIVYSLLKPRIIGSSSHGLLTSSHNNNDDDVQLTEVL